MYAEGNIQMFQVFIPREESTFSRDGHEGPPSNNCKTKINCIIQGLDRGCISSGIPTHKIMIFCRHAELLDNATDLPQCCYNRKRLEPLHLRKDRNPE
ncbi:predicted protein [Sclerotinia sclerotiorum 1980 UF-70]|uniref:Uncharacterized protein n=1 Tax=Sclerotinia sclerotiorum (strain ATCC 18683 / 1980 / Ss-1) TaxID=665079 RepID=A7EYE9_SCLS1|nr:predicted protein [Sclerotinia sclerotiorum 1980 UF-70]EDN94491.1 predicted protein [Sclerotinia sclerotiorum 1980 UF-70]